MNLLQQCPIFHTFAPTKICSIKMNTHCRGRITVQLIYSLARLDLDKEESMLLFVCTSELVESNLVKGSFRLVAGRCEFAVDCSVTGDRKISYLPAETQPSVAGCSRFAV